MAVKSRSTYVSKGQRRSVSRDTCKAMRASKTLYDKLDDKLQSERDRALNSKKSSALAKKYNEQDRVQRAAEALFEQYKGKVQWSACVQAVKSDWVTNFHAKYSNLK